MADIHRFHVADFAIFSITILISVSIGIYYALSGDRQRTTSEYLVGGRKMSFMPVAISLLVSFESSIMMLGVPAEVYVYGVQWIMANLGFFTANLISMCLIVPLIHPLQITSIYEYLELRFKSKAVRLFGTILGVLTTLWYMGIVLFGPGIALEAVTGFPKGASIALIAFAAAIYTSIGGLKAVVWTDVFQAIVMFSGCFAILIKGTIYSGGPKAVWDIAEEGKRMNFFVFDLDPTIRHTFWGLYFGSLVRGLGFAFNQSTCQRISSTPTLKDAYKMLLITTPGHLIALSLAAYEGVVAYSYYTALRCDPLESDQISDPNQLIPFMVMDMFRELPGMPGLFLASLFSASLSTLSTGLSSLSAIILEDIVKEIPRYSALSEIKYTVIAKISVIISAIVACGVAYMIAQVGGTMTQIASTLISAFAGPLTGLFLLGALLPWGNVKGAMVGTLLSVILCTWLGIGSSFSKTLRKEPWLPAAPTDQCLLDNSTTSWAINMTISNLTSHDMYTTTTIEDVTQSIEPQGLDKMYSLSYTWFGAVGVITAMVVGSTLSLLTGPMAHEDLDTRYILPYVQKLTCCLPEVIRHYLRCDLDFTKTKVEKSEKSVIGLELKIEKPMQPEEMVLLNGDDEVGNHHA
ncbi:hypothetical protein SNE40_000612 [Patella caerulea]|uniref:Sodium-coupled monocarboxylate transporter 1 n=1 Tax=Patella caerulea TaxID=87958 RepID=A0AAN8KLP7_PATCE